MTYFSIESSNEMVRRSNGENMPQKRKHLYLVSDASCVFVSVCLSLWVSSVIFPYHVMWPVFVSAWARALVCVWTHIWHNSLFLTYSYSCFNSHNIDSCDATTMTTTTATTTTNTVPVCRSTREQRLSITHTNNNNNEKTEICSICIRVWESPDKMLWTTNSIKYFSSLLDIWCGNSCWCGNVNKPWFLWQRTQQENNIISRDLGEINAELTLHLRCCWLTLNSVYLNQFFSLYGRKFMIMKNAFEKIANSKLWSGGKFTLFGSRATTTIPVHLDERFENSTFRCFEIQTWLEKFS